MTLEKLNQAIALIKEGNKQAALPILKEVLRVNPRNEHAWLWLYSCVDQVEHKKFCLRKALAINPGNLHAHNALSKLTGSPSQPVPQATFIKAARPQPVPTRKPKTNPNRRYWFFAMGMASLLFVCIIISALYLLGSGQFSAVAAGLPFFPSPTLTPSLTPTATATPSPSPTATETATLLPSPTLNSLSSLGTAGIVPLEELESYRMQGKMTMGGELDSASMTWTFTKEWVKASSAQRIVMSIQDMAMNSDPLASNAFSAMDMEAIVIGHTAWMKYENDWIQIDSQQALYQQNSVPSPVSDWQSLTFVGDEIINGIPCIHYTVDEDTMKISGPDDYQDITMHTLGDVWIANQPGLPPVILRVNLQMRMDGFLSSPIVTTANQLMTTPDLLMETLPQVSQSADVIYSFEYDVTDINTGILIEPPETSSAP